MQQPVVSSDALSLGCAGVQRKTPASSAARRPDRLTAGGWATLQDGCIRVDTWYPGRASSRLAATTHKSLASAIFAARTRVSVHQRQRVVNRLSRARQVQRSSRPRDVGRRVLIGCGYRCHVEAVRRGPSLDFPHTPRRSCAFPAGQQCQQTSSPPRRCNLRPTARLLQPCQRALLWPASIQPPLHQSTHRAPRALTTTGITCTTTRSSQTGLHAFHTAPKALGRCSN